MGLKEDFDKAATDVRNLKASPSNAEMLEVYAFFKQGSVGDCNTKQPGIIDQTNRAKWSAWDGKKGMSKDDAMKHYIEKSKQLVKSIGLK